MNAQFGVASLPGEDTALIEGPQTQEEHRHCHGAEVELATYLLSVFKCTHNSCRFSQRQVKSQSKLDRFNVTPARTCQV